MLGLIGLLRFKWTYLVVGAGLIVLGLVGYVSAHPAAPVRIDGTITSYVEYTRNGTYDRNELQIAGDSNTYTLDKTTFHPTLPDALYKDGKVSIWIDQGSTTVIAITLYDANDANPTRYTTPHFDNPTSERSDVQQSSIVAMVIGGIGVLVFGIWFVASRPQQAAVAAAAPGATPIAPGAVSPDGKFYWDGVRWVAREASTVS